MDRKRRSSLLGIVALSCVGVVGAALGGFGTPAHAKTGATIIKVKAGTPSELAYTISKFSLIKPGVVTFQVTNAGTVPHDFKVCTTAVTSAKNSCVGKGTKQIQPGKSATLTLTLKKAGKYEFLCSITGHAAAGMKGLLGIGVKVSGAQSAGTSTTPGTKPKGGGTTTTSTGPSETLVGDPNAGATVFASAGCGGCHVLAAARSTGTVGPNLDDAKPGQDLVIQRVTNGINAMPAFSSSLSSKQIQDLAAYVYRSTHT
jgi:uncharacterized cupredoxin-like copper-binding protein/cytochrome c5